MGTYSLKSGSQKLVQLLFANFRIQKLWEFPTAAKGRAFKKDKTLIRH